MWGKHLLRRNLWRSKDGLRLLHSWKVNHSGCSNFGNPRPRRLLLKMDVPKPGKSRRLQEGVNAGGRPDDIESVRERLLLKTNVLKSVRICPPLHKRRRN